MIHADTLHTNGTSSIDMAEAAVNPAEMDIDVDVIEDEESDIEALDEVEILGADYGDDDVSISLLSDDDDVVLIEVMSSDDVEDDDDGVMADDVVEEYNLMDGDDDLFDDVSVDDDLSL